MNILLKHIMRNMKENMGRTLLIMLSLCVVSVLVAIISLMILFLDMIDDAHSNLASFDYRMNSTTDEYILEDIVEEIKENFEIFAISEVEHGSILDEEEKYVSAELLGLKIEDAIKFKFIEINDDNVELKENEAIITSELSKKYKLKEGDEFEYYGRNSQKHILKVKYIVKSLITLGEIEIVTNEETYLNIINENKMTYMFLFGNSRNSTFTKEEIENFEMKLGLNFEDFEESNNVVKEIIYPGIIIGILVFSVIYVSLNSIIKIIINERIPVIGSFRSIGTTKKQIVLMLIVELLIYTIIPALVGAVIGVFAIDGLSSMVEIMLQSYGSTEKVEVVEYIIPITLITISVTVVFQIFLSIFEIIKLSKMSIKDSIFNKHTSIYKYSVTKIIFGIFFFIIGLFTVMKNKQLNYWYCLTGILSIFISIVLLVPAINKYFIKILEKIKNPLIVMATNTLKNSSLQINTNIIFIITISVSLVIYSYFNYMIITEKSKQNQVNSDVYVEEIGYSFETIYDKTNEFYKLENVKSVSSILDMVVDKDIYDEIKLANHSIKELHLVYSENYQELMKDSNLLKINTDIVDKMKKYDIMVSEYYKDIYDLKKGDTIVLQWQKKEENFNIETPINLQIVDFVDLSRLQNNTIIISKDLEKELNSLLFKGLTDAKYFINLKDNSSEATIQTRKDIISELGIHSNGQNGLVYTKEGYTKLVKDNSKNNVIFMTIIVVLIVGLALIGIINNQTVSFMERRRELATMYSIAMSRKQLNNMILIENVLAFLSSTITSIVFYIIISKLVEYTLQILLIPISIKFTISGILILFIIIAMILFEIQKYMREHIKNMNIVEEIKYE